MIAIYRRNLDSINAAIWNTKQAQISAVLVISIVWLLFLFLFFEGFCGTDDFKYLRFAYFWDHYPQNHWEARIIYNILLRLSLITFGFNEIAAAIPTIIGSLLLFVAIFLIAWKSSKGIKFVWIAGTLGSSLPYIVLCTTPNARPLATGFFSLAFALLLFSKDKKLVVLAGSVLGIAVATHLSLLSCAGIALLALPISRANSWRNSLLAFIAMLISFTLSDLMIYALWTGDPLYRFHVISSTHMITLDSDPNAREILKTDGNLNIMFFIKPIRDLFFSKLFALLLGLAAIGGVLIRRHLTLQYRALLFYLCLAWVWQSFGSQSPTAYKPFPGTTPYWGGLILPTIVLAAEVLCLVNKKPRLIIITTFLVAINLGILSLSGSWGQSVDMSKELLSQMNIETDVAFVSDDTTIEQLFVINGFSPPTNLFLTPVSKENVEVNVTKLHDNIFAANHIKLMVNELNFGNPPDISDIWVRTHYGKEVYRGYPVYRLLTYLLPESYRRNHSWTVRRPAVKIYTLQ